MNRFMVNQGKSKIEHLKQLGAISEQVMDKLYDIITPPDEREDYKAFKLKEAGQDARARKLEKLMTGADLLAMKRAQNRELKAERLMQ